MLIRIPKALIEANQEELLKEPWNLDAGKMRWKEDQDINIRRFTVDELRRLKDILYSETIRGSKTICRDIDAWVAACSVNKGTKARARSTRIACDLLTEFCSKLPRHHVYMRVNRGNEGVTLPYYIGEIEYHERDKRGDRPEFISIKTLYTEFDVRHSRTVYLYSHECINHTPYEMLVNKELLPETPQLREDYEFFMELMVEWKDLIGHQFLAVGLADDEDIDGNNDEDDDRSWWRSSKTARWVLDANGSPSRVVLDIYRESTEPKEDRDANFDTYFWFRHRKTNRTASVKNDRAKGETEDDVDYEEDVEDILDENDVSKIDVPTHPFLVCFDLKKHKRLRIHVGNLKPYKYDPKIGEKLVLPEKNRQLIDTLLTQQDSGFRDVLAGKTGGVIVLCQGKPGTGKTLTAEIYSEARQRPLYTVQCSQLGTDPETLENALLKVLARGRRWNAVMLLDEADVYVHERGSDLIQNAIVGVFLRVLEYHAGVLFLTTNRGDLVDDAILSRCTARIPYEIPPPELQYRIWMVMSDVNEVELTPKQVHAIVDAHPHLSGRDIKNLLKLAMMVSHRTGQPIDAKLIDEVKQFKPTSDEQ